MQVIGNLRDYEGKKHLHVYSINNLDDWNDLTHHFLGTLLLRSLVVVSLLDVILVHCQRTKGGMSRGGMQAMQMATPCTIYSVSIS